MLSTQQSAQTFLKNERPCGDVAHSIIIIKRIGKREFLFYVNMSTLAAEHHKQSLSYCLVCQAWGENKNRGAKNGNLELPWACFYFHIVFYEQASKGRATVCLLLHVKRLTTWLQ